MSRYDDDAGCWFIALLWIALMALIAIVGMNMEEFKSTIIGILWFGFLLTVILGLCALFSKAKEKK